MARSLKRLSVQDLVSVWWINSLRIDQVTRALTLSVEPSFRGFII